MSGAGRVLVRCAAALTLAVTAACGSAAKDDGPTVLTWYTVPDRVDAASLAETCTTASDGAYRIRVEQLPADVTGRHELLARRLRSRDSGIDLLTLDTSLTAEVAAGGRLAPVPADLRGTFSADVAKPALAAATYDGELVAAPWWLDPQVLWFRGNTAERAGLDTTGPITWDDLLTGARRLGVTVQLEDRDGSGLAAWVDALVAGSGGSLLEGAGRDAKVGIDSDAGRAAASIVQLYADQQVGPGPSDDALRAFAAPDGGFLLASTSAIADRTLVAVAADMGAAAYPVVADASVAPLAGQALAVPADARHRGDSFDAIGCLTSPEVLAVLATSGRHVPSRRAAADEDAATTEVPAADLVRKAVDTGRTVPLTPAWPRVQAAIDDTWQPAAGGDGLSTEDLQEAVEAAVAGRLP